MSDSVPEASALRAGAAKVDITPKMGIHLEGSIGRYRPALFVNDPIYARALVLEAGGRKLCVVSLDLLAVTVEWASEIRRRAAEEFGFDPKAVMVIGNCGSEGGVFYESYNLAGPVDQIIPVNVYVPGCPPRPEAIIEGVAKAWVLLEQLEQQGVL